MGQRMTWEEIKERYPHQNVGLVDCLPDKNNIKSAIVICSEEDTSYDDICLMAVRGKCKMTYTTLDEDLGVGGYNYV